MGRWSEELHPRGPGGKFAAAGGVLRGTRDRFDGGGGFGARSTSAFHPPTPASTLRGRKRRIQVETELARGARQPTTWRERDSLDWASPQKRDMQRALTGDVRMPRREAIRAAAMSAKKFARKTNTVGVKKTFAGKARRVTGVVPPPGTKPTARGRFNLAKYGRSD